MIKLLLLAFALLLPSLCQADHLVLSFGPSLNGSAYPKLVTGGYEFTWETTSLVATCGAMFESGLKGVCSIVPSVRVETVGGIFTRVGVGPAFITGTDERLSSIFEFNIQYAIGITQSGWDVGLVGNHYSNAGIWPPNYGRDFLGLLVDIGF